MARKKRPSKVRPKTPSRIRKKTTRHKTRSHHHPELIGLGLLLFGLFLFAVALALVLGAAHGGYLGEGLESLFGRLIGTTGTRLLGAFVLIAGVLLVSGASAGAILRRSGHAMQRAARARPTRRGAAVAPPPLPVEADKLAPL